MHFVFQLQILFISLKSFINCGAFDWITVLNNTIIVLWLHISAVIKVFDCTNILLHISISRVLTNTRLASGFTVEITVFFCSCSQHFLIVIHVAFQITLQLLTHMFSVFLYQLLAHKWEIIVSIMFPDFVLILFYSIFLLNNCSIRVFKILVQQFLAELFLLKVKLIQLANIGEEFILLLQFLAL